MNSNADCSKCNIVNLWIIHELNHVARSIYNHFATRKLRDFKWFRRTFALMSVFIMRTLVGIVTKLWRVFKSLFSVSFVAIRLRQCVCVFFIQQIFFYQVAVLFSDKKISSISCRREGFLFCKNGWCCQTFILNIRPG